MDELKHKILAALHLDEVNPADIQPDAPLFGGGLGLDSIDSLEVVSMLERDYGIVINEMSVAQRAFASLRSLATFVATERKK